MPQIQSLMVMDWVLPLKCEAVRTGVPMEVYLNQAGNELKLFLNNLTLTPMLTPHDFTEANYNGYAPHDMEDAFNECEKIQDGQWATRTNLITFEPPATGSSNAIVGIYMTTEHEEEEKVFFAAKFDTPIVLEVGGDPLVLRVRFDEWASMILCAECSGS